MEQTNYTPTFLQAGLTESQAIVFEALLKNGEITAAKLFEKTPLKKGHLYKILDELKDLELIEVKDVPGKITTFQALHPDSLKNLLTKKEEQVKNAQASLNTIWPKLTQDFNLSANKPTIQFFEGKEGVERVVQDSFNTKNELYIYLDYTAVQEFIPELPKIYYEKRDYQKILKKILSPNTEQCRYYTKNTNHTVFQARFLETQTPFSTFMQIYDNKMSYVSLSPNRKIAILIEDSDIAKTHKTLFEIQWQTAIEQDIKIDN